MYVCMYIHKQVCMYVCIRQERVVLMVRTHIPIVCNVYTYSCAYTKACMYVCMRQERVVLMVGTQSQVLSGCGAVLTELFRDAVRTLVCLSVCLSVSVSVSACNNCACVCVRVCVYVCVCIIHMCVCVCVCVCIYIYIYNGCVLCVFVCVRVYDVCVQGTNQQNPDAEAAEKRSVVHHKMLVPEMSCGQVWGLLWPCRLVFDCV